MLAGHLFDANVLSSEENMGSYGLSSVAPLMPRYPDKIITNVVTTTAQRVARGGTRSPPSPRSTKKQRSELPQGQRKRAGPTTLWHIHVGTENEGSNQHNYFAQLSEVYPDDTSLLGHGLRIKRCWLWKNFLQLWTEPLWIVWDGMIWSRIPPTTSKRPIYMAVS